MWTTQKSPKKKLKLSHRLTSQRSLLSSSVFWKKEQRVFKSWDDPHRRSVNLGTTVYRLCDRGGLFFLVRSSVQTVRAETAPWCLARSKHPMSDERGDHHSIDFLCEDHFPVWQPGLWKCAYTVNTLKRRWSDVSCDFLCRAPYPPIPPPSR